jgi:predicted GIY-YIG superfamily endonuclease
MSTLDEIEKKINAMTEDERNAMIQWSQQIKRDYDARKNKIEHVYFPNELPGIYCITNKKNGKKYIGKSVDVNKRICTHRSSLNNGYHQVPELQKDYNEFGSDYFEVIILEEVYNVQELDIKESYWIRKHSSKELYNKNYH